MQQKIILADLEMFILMLNITLERVWPSFSQPAGECKIPLSALNLTPRKRIEVASRAL
jgi:hypothetical protein